MWRVANAIIGRCDLSRHHSPRFQDLHCIGTGVKRHWGYDDYFIELCRAELSVSEEDVDTDSGVRRRGRNRQRGRFLLAGRISSTRVEKALRFA